MRMRKKPNLIPRMERCAVAQIKNPGDLRGRWLAACGDFSALHVELGCGKGRFTALTAEAMPETLLVAIERVPEAMVMAMERVCAAGTQNVRFLDRDVATLPEAFAAGEVERIYINFCDPWPGRRHADRRLTSGGFLALYRTALCRGGEIHFKTDNAPLFADALIQFEKAGFALSQVTRDLHRDGPRGIMTDYETKFYEQGTPICRCVARLSDREDEGK